MKVLIIGSGGREHALAWKVAQSPLVEHVFAAPGNPGIAEIAQCVNIKSTDLAGLRRFAQEMAIDLTIVGPELPLAAGIVDEFNVAGLKIFGPTAQAAQIEASKVFSKDLMKKYHIPTANYETFTQYEAAMAYLSDAIYPLVIKADGLAAGKGVIIVENLVEAQLALESIMVHDCFGQAGAEVVIEEFLIGEEVSLMAFVDGETVLPMVTAQDHKRAYDHDQGPNTGGMGAYSPVPAFNPARYAQVVNEILKPTIDALRDEGIIYKGVLYAGLMMTAKGPKVLEYNCRFGDPETQVVIPRLINDLVEVALACVDGRLDEIQLKWSRKKAVCIILASGGYPGTYTKGYPINGLEQAAEDALVFHAGTKNQDGTIITNGGRVLGVTADACYLGVAIRNAYRAAEKISFKDMMYRTDIGAKGMK